jgi:actin-like protein 6B
VRPDEVSALVLDIGTSTLRAGYAGDDSPKAIIPTSYGFVPTARDGDVAMTEADTEAESAPQKDESKLYIGQHGPSVWRENMQIGNSMSEGLSACAIVLSFLLALAYSSPKSPTSSLSRICFATR